MSRQKNILKNIVSDTLWCTIGLVLMNCVVQFAVYPIWSRRLGAERYGDILYLMSVVNIAAYSVGAANNLARMKASAEGETKNSPYLAILLTASAVILVPGFLFGMFGGVKSTVTESLLFTALLVFTTWRYYCEVQYRLNIDYRGYFRFYLIISAGYLLGTALYFVTGLWPVALLPGEAACILLIRKTGSILRWDGRAGREELSGTLRAVSVLFCSMLLSDLIMNSDRILLKLFIGGTSVTIYYLASLLGKTVTLITKPLNSVILGYLAKYKGTLTLRFMHLVTLASLAACLAATVCCTVGSHILIRILYPQSYEAAKSYFVIGNLAQIFCFAAGVVGTILLRFTQTKCQIYLNGAYAAAFVVLCIPGTRMFGFDGFCVAMLMTGFVRYITAIILGYRQAAKNTDPGSERK